MSKLPCPPELWPEFSELLEAALDLSESERPHWLAAQRTEHAAVLPWLVEVLAINDRTLESRFMQALTVDKPEVSEFVPGQQFGVYVLEKRLGSGGMGEVWLATRSDGTLNRRVALKLPHSHLLAGPLRRRFERERDILAGLSHPHIAQLYDAGFADSHHPFLAMEWVDGVPITEHCRDTGLPLQRRLDLFLQILDAVGYAHGRLIAHRDIKPSNVLVTRDESVKLLDFGIAKLLMGDTETGATELTRMGSCMATPDYAAPEQLAGEPITVAVDLYALGVVLYELLTGNRPLRNGRKAPIGGTDMPRASSQIAADHAKSVGGLDGRQLRQALNGDLDAIIGKALEANPAQRYHSAEAFALDIQRSRHHQPISARRIGPAALVMKFVRRHRLGVVMTVSLVLALFGGAIGITWQAVRAEREAHRATTIKDFLLGVFRASDPRISGDKPRGEITARALLDISSKRIESSFAQQPGIQVELLGVTADIYRELDETKRSSALYAREAELAQKFYGAADMHSIDGLLGQAYNADVDGDGARALALLARADPLIRQARLENTAMRARWLLIRGEALAADPEQGEAASASIAAAAALFKAVAPRDPLYPDALTDLGALSLDRSQFAQSAGYYREAIALEEPNPQMQGNLLLANAGLALSLKNLGDFDGASAAFESGTRVAERTFGRDSHTYWATASDWAQFRYDRGQRETALAAFETLLKDLPNDRAAFRNASDALEAAQVLRKYGHCLARDGQGAKSVELLQSARSLVQKSATHPADAAILQMDLGNAYDADGRIQDARNSFLAALSALQAQHAPASQLMTAHERWGRFLLSQKDIEGALTEFDATLHLSKGHSRAAAILAQAGLAGIAISRGDGTAALQASSRAMDQLDHIEGAYDIRIEPDVWGIHAQALAMTGHVAESRALAKRTRDAALRYYAPGSAAVVRAQALLQETTSGTFPH
jgi:eukaryotic-like serine/threonine-protein kinase